MKESTQTFLIHKYNFLKRLRITNLVSKVKLQTKDKKQDGLVHQFGLENRSTKNFR